MVESHLVLMVHGLWGSASNLDRIDAVLKTIMDKDDTVNLHTFVPTSFSQFKTYDGIEHIGNYVIQSLFKELESLNAKGITIDKISFIGYSLGGLVSRYVIGELYGSGFFDIIKPVFFTTFATPHMGTRFFTTYGCYASVLNFLGSNFLGQSGKDLFIKEGKNGILYKLADKKGKYFKSLLQFKKLISFANVRYDRTVPFYTSFMTEYDAFKDWEHTSVETVKGLPTAHVLSDEHSQLQHIETQIIDLANSSNVHDGPVINGHYNSSKTNSILVLGISVMAFIFPIVFTVSVFATVKSFIRTNVLPAFDIDKEWSVVKLVLAGKYDLSVDELSASEGDLELGKQEIANATREFVEDGIHIVTTNDEEKLMEEIDENDIENDKYYNIDCEFRVHCDDPNKAIDILLENSKFPIINSPLTKNMKPLPFDSVQREIHDNLNDLDWIKVPIYLQSMNAHQTIVARRGFSRTSQGIPFIFLYGYYVKRLLTTSSD